MMHSCNCLTVNSSIWRSHIKDVKILSIILYFLLIFILVNWMARMACIVQSLLTSHVDSLILSNRSLDSLTLLVLQPQWTSFIVLFLGKLICHRYGHNFCSLNSGQLSLHYLFHVFYIFKPHLILGTLIYGSFFPFTVIITCFKLLWGVLFNIY